MLFVQISDIHLKAKGKFSYQQADTQKNLIDCVSHINNMCPQPDFVLITGDLVDVGDEEEYVLFCDIIKTLSAPIFVIPGNHDNRALIKKSFFSTDNISLDSKYIQYAINNYPIRLIALDTLVEGNPYGILCEERLAWLDSTLQEEQDKTTVIFMHHPPTLTGIWGMDMQRLKNSDEFYNILRSYPQVKNILCGHVHRSIQVNWNGILVSIAPSCSHPMYLSFVPNEIQKFVLGPRGYAVHYWNNDQIKNNYLITHEQFVEHYEGPYPFFDDEGNLID